MTQPSKRDRSHDSARNEATIARFSSARTKNGQLPEPISDRISTLPLEKLSALLMRRSGYLIDNLGTPEIRFSTSTSTHQ